MSLTFDHHRHNNRLLAEQFEPATEADIHGVSRAARIALHQDFDGTLVWRGNDKQYNQDRKLANPAFDQKPILIAYCQSNSDIRAVMEFCRDAGLPMVMRSGGHSETGYSSVNDGVILDTSRFSSAHMDPDNRLMHVGPGTPFKTFWSVADEHGLAATGGACPTVCVGGYMQGGGFGFTARMYGMSCDCVSEIEVMLADGRLVRANESLNADLFYAVRGGTGNNFGVVTQVTYAMHPLAEATGFWIRWKLQSSDGTAATNAAKALDVMQREYMSTNNDERIGFQTIFAFQGPAKTPDMEGSVPYLLMRVMFNGTEAEGRKALASMLACEGAELTEVKRDRVAKLNDGLINTPMSIPQFPPGTDILPEAKQSRYLNKPLGVDNWRKVVDFFLSVEQRLNIFSIIDIEASGAAVNKRSPGDNAYVHRDVDGDIFLDVFWRDEQEKVKALKFLEDWVALIEPMSNGRVYQNYPNADVPQWWECYWGDYWGVLRDIKKKYDPDNFFNFPQGIGNIPAGEPTPSVTNPVADSLAKPITYLK